MRASQQSGSALERPVEVAFGRHATCGFHPVFAPGSSTSAILKRIVAMALHLTNRNVAHEIAARIRVLIARQDDGDVIAAARRLERPIADVYLPERLISCGDNPVALDFLADVVRGYEADACWLITGTSSGSSRTRPPMSKEARVTILELLGELSDQLLDEARRERRVALTRLQAEKSRGHPH